MYRMSVVVLVVSIWGSVGDSRAVGQIDEKTRDWAERIVLGPEFGSGEKRTARWVRSPTLSVYGGSSEHHKVVEEVVAHLNEVLGRTTLRKIVLVKPKDRRADIRVHFAELDEFPKLGKQYRFRVVPDNYGYFHTFWGRRRTISRAVVLIATDKLQGKWLRHFVLEEITQSLGLSNDSSVFRDSIFFADGDSGGAAQVLSERDKRLLEFFYNRVPANSDQATVRRLLEKYWPR